MEITVYCTDIFKMEVPKEIEEQYVNENWTKEELIEALDDKIWDCLDTYEIDDIVVN